MRSIPIRTLLLATLLAAPLSAQIPGGLRAAPRAQAPGNGSTVVIWPRHIQTLQARLDSFAMALPPAERALWNDVLLRAVHAPTPSAGELRVTPVLEIGPGGGCEDAPGMDDAANRVAIVVQGGRTAGASGIVVQGGRTPRAGIVVQGGRTPGARGAEAPRPNPTGDGTAAIGPKQDDPAPRPGRVGAVAIGPKQDDPTPPPQSLGRRLADFSLRLPAEERATLNWLLTRAASAPEGRPGTPGGLPPGAQAMGGFWWPPLPKALGIEPLAIGPKQDDPRPPSPEQRWILRY